MKRSLLAMVPAATLMFAAAASNADSMGATARYRVEFERTWSSSTHPQDFPLLAHFSPVIGVTQAKGYEWIAQGATATAGLEKLCEEGKHQPLDAEIASAMKSGSVGALIETAEPLREVPQTAVVEFDADDAHPTVTIAAMIAPSPDWCAVAVDVALVRDGKFADSVQADLVAWDMGTDAATSYRAFDADMSPRGPIAPSAAPFFQKGGAQNPVGRVTFTRIN